MADLVTACLARRIIVDSQTNLPTLVDVMTSIEVQRLPVPGALISLFTTWRRSASKDNVFSPRIVVLRPDGSVASKHVRELAGESRYHKWLVTFSDLQLDAYGTWSFRLELKRSGKWKLVANVPLDVDQPNEEE